MEQNVRNFGVFVATLAMIASVLIVPSVSADGHDLEITGSGDDGITSYASQYGTAEFTIDISSMTDSAHSNVIIGTSVYWGKDEDGNNITTEATVTDCSDDPPASDLSAGAGESITACIYVSPAEGGADIGDSAELTVTATSDEDSIGSVMAFTMSVTNWFASSIDSAQSYAEGDTNTYTITVHNIKVDTSGTAEELSGADMPIYVTLSTATPGWNVDSTDAAWDEMELTATINYISAAGSYDLVLDITLVGEIVPASSYVGNSFVVFGVNDGAVYSLVSLEAIVADNFGVTVSSSATSAVACDGGDSAATALSWVAQIKNYGNTMDSFAVTFDTSNADAAGWTIDGAAGFNTEDLNPKYEHNEVDGTGMYTVNLGLHVPAELAAGTSHGFTMTAVSDADSTVTQTQSYFGTVDQCYAMTMAVDQTAGSGDPGDVVDFAISVTNDGNAEDTFSLTMMDANADWSPTLSESSLTVASGATGQAVFSMTVPSDEGAGGSSGPAMIHATSSDGVTESSVTVSAQANQVYALTTGYYYNATTGSASVQEGMSIQMKFNVTNGGNGNDEIALSLANAPAWVTLGQATALAGPGQVLSLTIDIAGPASDARGEHTFQVIATSADGTTSSTSGDFTITVTEKVDATGGPTTEELDEEEGGLPGFGALSAIAAIGAVLLIRRRL